jgi:hypothetical protein
LQLWSLYPQAFCNKYFGARNAVIFAPQQLRELGSELHLELEPRFADLAGEDMFERAALLNVHALSRQAGALSW